MTGKSRIVRLAVLGALAIASPMVNATADAHASGRGAQGSPVRYAGRPRRTPPAPSHHDAPSPASITDNPALQAVTHSRLRALVLQEAAHQSHHLPGLHLVPMTSTANSSPPPVSISTVAGKFFPNPNNSGAFDVTPSTAPAFTQSFPVIDFNPPSTAQVSCSNSTGVDENTRPFTDVIPQSDGSCTTDAAGSAGTGSLSNFEAEFQANLTVAAAGQVTFNFYSDDGWVLSMGPSNGIQPTYASGSMVNPPASGPFTGYPVVGSYNQPSSPTQVTVTVNVPAAGTYPIEVDYTECCGGSLALTLGTTYGNPIQSGTITGPSKYEVNSPSEHSTTCNTARPINCATGAFWHTFNDLAIPGRGMALDFAQTYDSPNAAKDSPLGFGWTDSYNLYLSADSSGNITVHEEGGTTVTFTNTSSGYQPPSRVLATLVSNSDGTLTFTRIHSQKHFTFAAPSNGGRLLKERDRNGYVTTLNYNGSQLSSVTDPAGRSLSFSYNSANRIASITDPANRTVSFDYDAAGNLTSYIDVAGGVTKFSYDANHLLLSMTDPNGGVTTNVYDSSNRVTSQTDPMSRTTSFAYTANPDGSQTTTITAPNGNVETELYENNELLKNTLGSGTPQAATWQYAYDPATLGVTSIIDPNGHASTNTWDAQGNLLSSTDALNHTTTYTYDSQNDVTSATDPNGVKTTLTYDARGNLTSIARPLASANQTATTSLTYGDSSHPGDLTAITDPNGHTTTIAYDANGNVSKVTDPLGNVTTGSYDAIGRLLSEVSPKGNAAGANPANYTTTLTYNPFGDVLTATDPLGHTTSDRYDADQNLTSVTDPLGHVTAYTYDADNEPAGVARADGSTLGMSYDADGNLLGQTDGLGQTTSYAYNPLDRVVSMTDPLNRTTKYTYDGTGNLTSLVDAMNRTTTYAYDAANELTGISYSDGKTPNVTYSYDKDGQRLSMADGTGTSSYGYDSLNRLISSKDGAGQTVGYGYDLAGNLTSLTYPDGSQVSRTYDALNRLQSVQDWLGHTTSFAYDPNSNLTKESYPNGTSAAFGYNAADQLIQIQDANGSGPLWTFGYTRDADGQVSATSDPLDSLQVGSNTLTSALLLGLHSVQHGYSYDALTRLTGDQRTDSVTTTTTTSSWSYNAGDELTGLADTSTGYSATLSYDAAHEFTQYQSQGGGLTALGSQVTLNAPQNISLSYNANGDRTGQSDSVSGGTSSYGYDQAERLTSFTTSGGTSAQYAYNGDGLRMSKTVNGTAEAFTWDEAEGMPLLLQDGSMRYLTGPGGLPLEQVDGSGTVLYYYQDQLGSTRALANDSGGVVALYNYTAYGILKSSAGNITTPFGFAGQYTDAESGLQYLRARYYDPSTAQFLSVDPLVAVTGQPYSYAGDNPMNWTDPTGLCKAGFVNVPFGGNENCSDDMGTAVRQHLPYHRLPDYITLQGQIPLGALVGFPFGGLQAGGTYDRYGNTYVDLGAAGGFPAAAGVSVNAGWINSQCVTEPRVEQYISGWTVAAGAYNWYGAQGVWGNVGDFSGNATGFEVGAGNPEITGSATYSWKRGPRRPVHW